MSDIAIETLQSAALTVLRQAQLATGAGNATAAAKYLQQHQRLKNAAQALELIGTVSGHGSVGNGEASTGAALERAAAALVTLREAVAWAAHWLGSGDAQAARKRLLLALEEAAAGDGDLSLIHI